MDIEIIPDIEEEIIRKLQETYNGIINLKKELAEKDKKILELEEQLKKLQEAESVLSEQTIPNLMQQAGISLLKLSDGSAVEVKPFYSARIPATKTEEAFEWLRQNGFGDLIKNNVTLTFGRSEDEQAKLLVDDLR